MSLYLHTVNRLVAEGSVIRHPRAVAIGNQEFVAVWTAGPAEDVALRARAFSLDRDTITFLPVVDPVTGEREFDGEAVDLLPHGLFVTALSAVRGRERQTGS